MWIKVFVDYLRFERNLSERTVEAYQADLEAFKQFYKNLNSELSWKTVDSDIVRDWEVSMMDNGNSASSVIAGLAHCEVSIDFCSDVRW